MAPLRKRSLLALALVAFAGCGPTASSGPVDNTVVCNAYAQQASHIEVSAEGADTRVPGTHPCVQSPPTGSLARLQPCGSTAGPS